LRRGCSLKIGGSWFGGSFQYRCRPANLAPVEISWTSFLALFRNCHLVLLNLILEYQKLVCNPGQNVCFRPLPRTFTSIRSFLHRETRIEKRAWAKSPSLPWYQPRVGDDSTVEAAEDKPEFLASRLVKPPVSTLRVRWNYWPFIIATHSWGYHRLLNMSLNYAV
jgi:hypothetical protein